MMKFPYKLILMMVLSVTASGCISTSTTERPKSTNSQINTQSSGSEEVDLTSNNEISLEQAINIEQAENNRDIKELNEKITLLASTTPITDSDTIDRFSYTLGPGDVIDIAVFQVEELNRKTRIAGDGYIMIPLIGAVRAGGLTTKELEDELTLKLGESYLHDPQVSVFIEEFRSHQVSVSGAVRQPNIYEIQRAQTVLEMLAMAGGLSDDAGPQVYVQRILTDQDTGLRQRESTVIKLDTLLNSSDPRVNMFLRAGDSVNVPKAGVVFVEGAVNSPGAYQIKGEMNVLKAIAVAGDVKFEAKESNVQIFREENGVTSLIEVDLDSVKSREIDDVTLLDGDIIVVPDNKLKKGWSGFWKGISGIFSVGTRI